VLPRHIDVIEIAGVDGQFFGVGIQNVLKVFSSVYRPVNVVGPSAARQDEELVRVGGIDRDAGDVLAAVEFRKPLEILAVLGAFKQAVADAFRVKHASGRAGGPDGADRDATDPLVCGLPGLTWLVLAARPAEDP